MSFARDARRAYEVLNQQGWSVLGQKIIKRLSAQETWSGYSQEAKIFATWLDFSPQDLEASQALHQRYTGHLDISSLTWFLPEFQHPYYGGIYTLLRFADYYKRQKGTDHQFCILGNMDTDLAAEKIAESFPNLAGSPIHRLNLYKHLDDLQPTDAIVATLWGTAYFALRFNHTRRKFYFLQDYEPLFYPAGSISAQVEASYRFGFYGLANTPTIKDIYVQQYGGQAEYFLPCIDTQIFHPPESPRPSDPLTVFFYGRPGHPRNGFELSAQALRLLKKRLGARVRILAAGDVWIPKEYGLDGVVENLGLLGYQQTAELYRTCHAGLVMMFTRHPSYLPFELMASGSLVVTNYNPATTWFLKDGENCRLAQTSATSVAVLLEQALLDEAARQHITDNAARQIQSSFSNWEGQMEKIYQYMRNPQDKTSQATA